MTRGRTYYNEIDKFAAQWLRNLIAAKLIAPGDVDERSIVDVRADDLIGYDQCHFFAGIGGWSYALRLAGWHDTREVWTGSCPCQPLSSAGQRKGHADERHLWPHFFRLIAERAPPVVFGEQVASKDGREWLAAVRSDLEDAGYACGAADLPAASVGAPHIRRRLWFVADTQRGGRNDTGLDQREYASPRRSERVTQDNQRKFGQGCEPAGGMAEPLHAERRPIGLDGQDGRVGAHTGRQEAHGEPGACGEVRAVADDTQHRRGQGREDASGSSEGTRASEERARSPEHGDVGLANPLCGSGQERERGNGAEHGVTKRSDNRGSFWSDLEWLPCTDGKARPTKPGLFPMVDGLPGRVGRLRGAGNAIVPQVAAEFIAAYWECQP